MTVPERREEDVRTFRCFMTLGWRPLFRLSGDILPLLGIAPKFVAISSTTAGWDIHFNWLAHTC